MKRISDWFSAHSEHGIALAFSGGTDSSLLLALLAQEKKFPVYALIMKSLFQSEEEFCEAQVQTKRFDIPLTIFSFDPFAVPGFRENPQNRCYLCKHAFFSQFQNFCSMHGNPVLIDGTNADDLKEYRPGLRALKELGVRSPLAELGISKKEIRQMAAGLGLAAAEKPSRPCFATRFEYGTVLTPEKIKAVETGEKLIREMLSSAGNVRLRVHGELARIELDRDSFTAAVMEKRLPEELKKLGFSYVTIDLEGFRSGSMDIKLKKG